MFRNVYILIFARDGLAGIPFLISFSGFEWDTFTRKWLHFHTHLPVPFQLSLSCKQLFFIIFTACSSKDIILYLNFVVVKLSSERHPHFAQVIHSDVLSLSIQYKHCLLSSLIYFLLVKLYHILFPSWWNYRHKTLIFGRSCRHSR
jgi:hypothetical protein